MPSNSAAYSVMQALDPAASVFVSANAGAGKTSLLTNRVLRLLLHGTPPSKILCLTFTNAAAAEMVSRVQSELGKWVMGDDTEVSKALMALTGVAPDKKALARARSLFATVLEAPEGVRIQTIHGFCQSLLRRFPIEAGVSPHFAVMDGRTEQELLQEARFRLFSRAQEHEELRESLNAMAQGLSETGIHMLLGEIIQHKRRFRSLLTKSGGVGTAINAAQRLLHIPKGGTLASLIETHFSYDEAALAQWRRIVSILKRGDDKEQKTAQGITDWLANKMQWEARVADYVNVFLTLKGEPRKTLFKKGTIVDADLIDTLKAEQERVWRFNDAWKALEAGRMTAHMLHIAEAMLALYDTLKRSRALMDYDDLILSARDLLERAGMAPWVLFKLDGGIDHILVDEAQVTSPEQWAIIDALTKEFFAGEGRTQQDRSLFVVGDEKQSIYSFQGADPAALARMQRYFSKAIKDAAKPVYHLPLTASYRSTSEILSAVDAVFAQALARAGLMSGDEALLHTPTRQGHPGLVEVWPLIQQKEGDEVFSPATQLARTIAETIRHWLDEGTAEAGDIMILVRSRTSLVDRLVRALKRRNVPVAGHDRMRLNDNLAVRDLMALGQCLLLPDDNLTLAALLKSPIFNISEESLFDLAYGHGDKSLWQQLSSSKACAPAFELLTQLRAKADFVSPHELYSWLLDTEGARKRFAGRMGEETHDPIDEFLGQALLYERSHPPSLQGFLHWLDASDSEIKRDMEQARDSVRIMTVHGAKGLQAPIVILPDTVEIPQMRSNLLWQEELPFWPISTDRHDSFCASLYDEKRQAMLAEYRRLLYVALTRAEDRLYICGATAKDKISEQSWYHLVKTGLTPLTTEFDMAWGKGLRLGEIPDAKNQKAKGNKKLPPGIPLADNFGFLSQPAPSEPIPPKPLSPSRLMDEEPAGASPLSATTVYQRGNLIHKLLQYLPDAPNADRERVARRIADAYKQTMPNEARDECIREAMAVLDDPKFGFLFAEGTLAEVPVAGSVEIDGKQVAIAGQIDRLAIGEKDVWIVDFKSNRELPEHIPKVYLRQMGLYRLLLERIYPKKTVHCVLLWTAAPRITVLDEALVSSYI